MKVNAMNASVKICIFALVLSNVLLQDMSGFTILDSRLRHLQDKVNSDGIFVLGTAAKINSIQVDGQEFITTAIDEDKATFIELKTSLGSLIEIQSTATNSAKTQPSVIFVVKYMNEEGQKEFAVSGGDWFCNEYPAKKISTKNLNDLFNLNIDAIGVWNDFAYQNSKCSIAIRSRRKSKLVKVFAFGNDKIVDFRVGSAFYKFKEDNALKMNTLEVIVNNGINNGDVIGLTATDLGISPGIGLRARIEFEDNFFQKRIINTNPADWVCDGQQANAVTDDTVFDDASKLKNAEKIWKKDQQGTTFCSFVYNEYPYSRTAISLSARATKIEEIRIGSYTFNPPAYTDYNRQFDISPIVDIKNGDLIYFRVSVIPGTYTALALTMSFRDTNGRYRIISTNQRDWLCNGNKPNVDANQGRVGDGVFIYFDNSLPYRVCYSVYRDSLNIDY